MTMSVTERRRTIGSVLVGPDGQVPIPEPVREMVGLAPGDSVEIVVTEDGVLLRGPIDPDQAWFWTPQIQAEMAEARADLAAGRTTKYDSEEEFLAALDAMRHADV
jgi:AbrB family looped-hinge helix DNA binding protein